LGVFLVGRIRGGGGLGVVTRWLPGPFPSFFAGTLAAVIARYRSNISSSSSMTSGSSASVKSSGIGDFAMGGAMMPVVLGGPTLAFPLSVRVGGVTGGHFPLACPITTCLVSLREDWAVNSSI
jgi:hypothetical protein